MTKKEVLNEIKTRCFNYIDSSVYDFVEDIANEMSAIEYELTEDKFEKFFRIINGIAECEAEYFFEDCFFESFEEKTKDLSKREKTEWLSDYIDSSSDYCLFDGLIEYWIEQDDNTIAKLSRLSKKYCTPKHEVKWTDNVYDDENVAFIGRYLYKYRYNKDLKVSDFKGYNKLFEEIRVISSDGDSLIGYVVFNGETHSLAKLDHRIIVIDDKEFEIYTNWSGFCEVVHRDSKEEQNVFEAV